MAMAMLERIASEKEPGQAIDAEHKFEKKDLSPAIHGNRRLNYGRK
jgi:hypothetical protein